MRLKGSLELYAYWNELRKFRSAPERRDLDPVAMRNFLSDTFILEVDTHGDLRFSLAGTQLNALFGTTLKGRSFLSLWTRDQQEEVAAVTEIVLNDSLPLVAGASGGPEGHAEADFELLLLPLRHRGKTHSRLLGRLSVNERPGWFGLTAIPCLRFGSMRVLQSASGGGQPAFGRRLDDFDLNTSAPTFEQHGHLRLYIANS